MSSLHEKIEADFLRMKRKRLKKEARKEAKKEMAEKEVKKVIILELFKYEIKKNLEMLKECDGFCIMGRNTLDEFIRLLQEANVIGVDVLDVDVKDILDMANELGFEVDQSIKNRYVMSVPSFKREIGKSRTQAQQMLCDCQRRLAKAKKEREEEILTECKKVKKRMKARHYVVESEKLQVIAAKAKKELRDDDDEFCIVTGYFSELGFTFLGEKDGKWRFKL